MVERIKNYLASLAHTRSRCLTKVKNILTILFFVSLIFGSVLFWLQYQTWDLAKANGGTVQFFKTTSSGLESLGLMNIEVRQTQVSANPTTVTLTVGSGSPAATGGGTDYTLSATSLTIPAGQTSVFINFTIVNDTNTELTERFTVTLSSPTNATLGANTVHTFSILDDDNPIYYPGGINSNTRIWLDAGRNTGAVNSGDPVSTWTDTRLGFSTTTASNTTSGQQPTYVPNVINGFPVVRFDGVNDSLDTISLSTNIPLTVFSVGQQRSWTNGDYIFDGRTTNNTAALYQTFQSPDIKQRAGTDAITAVSNFALNTPGVLTAFYNNNSSFLNLNNGTDVGNITGAGNPSGLTLGARADNTLNAEVDFAEMVVYNSTLNSLQRKLVTQYLGNKYGITLNSNLTQYNTYWRGQFGLGSEGTKISTGNFDGLILNERDTSITTNEYFMAGYSNTSTTMTGNDLSGNPLSGGVVSRWNRVWAFDKTGAVNMRIAFDFSQYNGGVPGTLSNYRLLYSSGCTGSFATVTTVSTVILNVDAVEFAVLDANLADGCYTIGTTDVTNSPLGAANGAITDLVATASGTSVNLSWSAPAYGGFTITDYIIQHSNDNFLSNIVTVDDGVSTSTSTTINNLTDSSRYSFRVLPLVGSTDSTSTSNVASVNMTPDILSISPSNGLTAGGTSVTISGTNFDPLSYKWAVKGEANSGSFLTNTAHAVDSQGNTYTTGLISGTVNIQGTQIVSSRDSYYVAKHNSSGVFQWIRYGTGSTHSGEGRGIAVDSQDNIYMVGKSFGNSDYGNSITSNVSVNQSLILKLDTNGNTLWVRLAGNISGTSNVSQAEYIFIDSADKLYIAGYHNSSGTFNAGSFSRSGAGSNDIYVMTYDTSGNALGLAGAGGTGDDRARAVTADIDGNIYLTGYYGSATVSFGSQTITNGGGNDAFLVQYNSSLVAQWAVTGSGTSNSSGYDLIYHDGYIYFAGQFVTSVTFGSTTVTRTAGDPGAFIARYNPNGTLDWLIATAGNDQNTVFSLVVFNNALYIGGEFQGTFTMNAQSVSANANRSSGFLARLTFAGEATSIFPYTGNNNKYLYDLSVKNGSLFASGTYQNDISFTTGLALDSGPLIENIYLFQYGYSSIFIDGKPPLRSTLTSTNTIQIVTPPNTSGGKNVLLRNSSGLSDTVTNGFYYGSTITNADIANVNCDTPKIINETTNCTITLQNGLNFSSVFGTVNLRVGSSGLPTLCTLPSSGLSTVCSGIAVGDTPGTYPIQFNASGSGSTYANGQNVVVEAPAGTTNIQNSNISTVTCVSPAKTTLTTNCTITLQNGLNFSSFFGSINVRFGASGTPTDCNIVSSGTSFICAVNAGTVASTLTIQYNASGSGSTYENAGEVVVINNVTTTDLIGYFDFDHPASYIGSGQGLTSLVGTTTATLGQSSSVNSTDPTFESSGIKRFVFDGIDDYISTDVSFQTAVNSGNYDFSFEVWFRRTDPQSDTTPSNSNYLGDRLLSTAHDRQLGLLGSTIQAALFNTTDGWVKTNTNFIPNNEWQMATFTFDADDTNPTTVAGVGRLYVNGVLQTTFNKNIGAAGTPQVAIGASGPAVNSDNFTGEVAVARVYTRAINQSEISQNFNQEKVKFGFNQSVVNINSQTTANFASGTVSSTSQNSQAPLGTVSFTDRRENFATWTATISVSNLTNGSYLIPARNLSVSPGALTTLTGSGSNNAAGGTGTFNGSGSANARSLLVNSQINGGGQFTLSPILDVTIPPGARSGTYTGTVTISLS